VGKVELEYKESQCCKALTVDDHRQQTNTKGCCQPFNNTFSTCKNILAIFKNTQKPRTLKAPYPPNRAQHNHHAIHTSRLPAGKCLEKAKYIKHNLFSSLLPALERKH